MRFWKKIKLLSLDDASPSSGKSGRSFDVGLRVVNVVKKNELDWLVYIV
ncbi:hypothetical protein HanRHA438_Chr15g0687921 [Helianthus annuus]|nr:hypothetical protein HanRHA438_Chr15g0687921 [Helianthus annuus]